MLTAVSVSCVYDWPSMLMSGSFSCVCDWPSVLTAGAVVGLEVRVKSELYFLAVSPLCQV